MVKGSKKVTPTPQPPPYTAPSSNQSASPPSLLDLIPIADEENVPQCEGSSYFDPQQVVLSHDLLASEIQKFGLDLSSCINCSPLIRHLVDPHSLYKKMSEDKIQWIQDPEAKMECPHPSLKTPIFDPSNADIEVNPQRPKGVIKATRLYKEVQDTTEFTQIAKHATLSVLKGLRGKPLSSQELNYKIRLDIDQGVLVPLEDFLQRDVIKKRGINAGNIQEHLLPSGLLVVYNPLSQSTQVRLCVNPAIPAKNSGDTVNKAFACGFHHIPRIGETLVTSQFFLTFVLGDIQNFYTSTRLDDAGSLLSAVYLQEPFPGSRYPTLSPERKARLKLFVYTAAKFGFTDAGSITNLAKSKFVALYQKHCPPGIHKVEPQHLAQVNESLCKSYVDDLFDGVTLYNIQQEMTSPSFIHSFVPNFQASSLITQGGMINIAKTRKLLCVLDFVGFNVKKFVSNHQFIEDFLNKDSRLAIKKKTHVRPDMALLQSEILKSRQAGNQYANTLPSDSPPMTSKHFYYLGMTILKPEDLMSVRAHPVQLRSRL